MFVLPLDKSLYPASDPKVLKAIEEGKLVTVPVEEIDDPDFNCHNLRARGFDIFDYEEIKDMCIGLYVRSDGHFALEGTDDSPIGAVEDVLRHGIAECCEEMRNDAMDRMNDEFREGKVKNIPLKDGINPLGAVIQFWGSCCAHREKLEEVFGFKLPHDENPVVKEPLNALKLFSQRKDRREVTDRHGEPIDNPTLYDILNE